MPRPSATGRAGVCPPRRSGSTRRGRATTDGVYWWGDELTRDYANFGTLECCSGATGGADAWLNTAPVGSFRPTTSGSTT